MSIAALFLVIFAIAYILFESLAIWALVVSMIFGIISLTFPWILLPINRLWHVLVYPLGLVLNHLVLGVFFLLILVPVGVILRLLSWDPMSRAKRPDAESYWAPVQRRIDPETLRDMF